MGESGAKWEAGAKRDPPFHTAGQQVEAVAWQRERRLRVFLGEYQHNVDEKGRIVMPAKFRARLESGAVVTKGQERCLYVFPQDRWADEVAKVNKLPRTNRRNRDYARAFFGGASDLQMDKQGRLPIPPPLRTFAGLVRDVVVVGVSDRLEIWDSTTWLSLSSQADEVYAGIEEALSEEGI